MDVAESLAHPRYLHQAASVDFYAEDRLIDSWLQLRYFVETALLPLKLG